jgi:hypothetical protein
MIRNPIPAFTLLFIVPASFAIASDPLSIPLDVPQKASVQRYTDSSGSACLVLDAGRPLDDQDIPGLQKLVADLQVQAGPGVQPELAGRGMPFVYQLVPQLKGSQLTYRGLLSSKRGSSVSVSARDSALLNDVVERDLGFGGAINLVFNSNCI